MKQIEARLMLGDCREELKKLADNSIDLIFTSPPYADSRKNTYGGITNLFTREFTDGFCVDGRIDWDKLVRFNSGKS